MSENRDGPPLLRPIPRRPFVTGPTPPEDSSESPQLQPQQSQSYSSSDHSPGVLNLDSINRRLLDPRNTTPSRFDSTGSESISRAQSFLNLTSSTLFGIYSASPTSSSFSGGGAYGDGGFVRDRRFYGEQDEPTTPWGTGAETPAKRLSVDEPYYDVHRERAGLVPRRGRARRRSSALQSSSSGGRRLQPLSRSAAAFHMGLRGLLLFGLGILYGALVARFQDRHNKTFVGRVQTSPTYDTNYMVFWGISGVALGVLLPWFDGVWESIFGQGDDSEVAPGESAVDNEDEEAQETDWALVIRGIGAFVGIVFAIRRLEWTSTLQVSLALALVNPFLWYLIDRSKPGLLLAAAVGVGGSAILMGLRSDMVPTPAASRSWSSSDSSFDIAGNLSSTTPESSPRSPRMVLGGLATQETVETGMWILSILFCCCVFFGNIGRRLALNPSGSPKGRWAERKVG